jgi:hypothetical protein
MISALDLESLRHNGRRGRLSRDSNDRIYTALACDPVRCGQ